MTIPGRLSSVHNSRYKHLDFLLRGSLANKKGSYLARPIEQQCYTPNSSNKYQPLKNEDLIERLKKVKSLAVVIYLLTSDFCTGVLRRLEQSWCPGDQCHTQLNLET